MLRTGSRAHCVSLFLLLAVVATPFSAAAAPPNTERPAVAFQSGSITVSRLTGNGEAIVFSVLQEPHKYWSTLVTDAKRLTADAGGVVHYTPPSLPLFSVWAVVDFQTGAVTVAFPPGGALRRVEMAAPAWKRDESGSIAALQAGRESIEMLIVRPNVGAWIVSNADGGAIDDDHLVNGRTMTAPGTMKAVGSGPPAPKRIVPHDVIVLIDPETMEVFTTEVAP